MSSYLCFKKNPQLYQTEVLLQSGRICSLPNRSHDRTLSPAVRYHCFYYITSYFSTICSTLKSLSLYQLLQINEAVELIWIHECKHRFTLKWSNIWKTNLHANGKFLTVSNLYNIFFLFEYSSYNPDGSYWSMFEKDEPTTTNSLTSDSSVENLQGWKKNLIK